MSEARAPRRASTVTQAAAGVGLAARRAARDMVWAVFHKERTLSEELDSETGHGLLKSLSERDRALARMIAATSFRRYGQIADIMGRIYERGLPGGAGRLHETLITAIAQLLFMDVPDHAAVALAMRLVNEDRRAKHYAGLANAGLRRAAAEGPAMAARQDAAKLNTPRFLWSGWVDAYGEATARAVAEAHLAEAGLDLTVKSDAAGWARRMDATLLPGDTLRLAAKGRIDKLPGFAEGAWWVQDIAASLPVRLLGDVAGRRVVDLCAAPGGKTMQLAAAGAQVTAVEKAPPRARRLRENLQRVRLQAEIVIADALLYHPEGPVDAVLLDAPCTATGTLRRHPDAAWTKGTSDRAKLAALQAKLLRHAADLLRPGGILVYCTCSLEPEEGEEQIAALLQARGDVIRQPVTADALGGLTEAVTPLGALRTLPHFLSEAQPPGMDGFYAARLVKMP